MEPESTRSMGVLRWRAGALVRCIPGEDAGCLRSGRAGAVPGAAPLPRGFRPRAPVGGPRLPGAPGQAALRGTCLYRVLCSETLKRHVSLQAFTALLRDLELALRQCLCAAGLAT